MHPISIHRIPTTIGGTDPNHLTSGMFEYGPYRTGVSHNKAGKFQEIILGNLEKLGKIILARNTNLVNEDHSIQHIIQ